MKFKPKIKFEKFERHNYDVHCSAISVSVTNVFVSEQSLHPHELGP